MSNQPSRKVVERLQTRLDHLARLADHKSGFVVDEANAAFKSLCADGTKPASILVRSPFVARKTYLPIEGDRDKTDRPKPPAADIVRSRGLAFRLELALLFVQQCQTKPGSRLLPVQTDDEDAFGLINMFATGTRRSAKSSLLKKRPTMRAAQVKNALDILNARGLVELVEENEVHSPYDDMWLNHERGRTPGKDPVRYKPLTEAEPTVSIPIEFFTNGWIQVLTDSEMWNWLAFRHQGKMTAGDSPPGIDISLQAQMRLGWYDLTRDAWDTHQMLDRLELMAVNPGEISTGLTAAGNQRFQKEPHQFSLNDKALAKPGHAAVTAAVAAALDEALDK